jgi:hypothetical protein
VENSSTTATTSALYGHLTSIECCLEIQKFSSLSFFLFLTMLAQSLSFLLSLSLSFSVSTFSPSLLLCTPLLLPNKRVYCCHLKCICGSELALVLLSICCLMCARVQCGRSTQVFCSSSAIVLRVEQRQNEQNG